MGEKTFGLKMLDTNWIFFGGLLVIDNLNQSPIKAYETDGSYKFVAKKITNFNGLPFREVLTAWEYNETCYSIR